MTADDENPVVRWQSIRDWYDEFARMPGWEFLRPMVDLTGWVAQQTWAARLFPSTSHEWLCVKLKPGYDPDAPLFSCVTRADGQLYFELWKSNGNQLEKQKFPVSEAQYTFWNFVQRLEGIA